MTPTFRICQRTSFSKRNRFRGRILSEPEGGQHNSMRRFVVSLVVILRRLQRIRITTVSWLLPIFRTRFEVQYEHRHVKLVTTNFLILRTFLNPLGSLKFQSTTWISSKHGNYIRFSYIHNRRQRKENQKEK